uniref:flavin reductase family protein n=1 Tax=Microbacterium sp. LWH7-1.2 TaxID=3135257 RepID=UPI0040535446
MTVRSVASIAIDPPTLMFSASAISSGTPTILRAETVVVHLLALRPGRARQAASPPRCAAFRTRRRLGRLPTGEPYYPAATWLRGRVVQRVDIHGSTLIIVEAIEGKPRDGADHVDPSPLSTTTGGGTSLAATRLSPKPVLRSTSCTDATNK